jgi:hypothetical protein
MSDGDNLIQQIRTCLHAERKLVSDLDAKIKHDFHQNSYSSVLPIRWMTWKISFYEGPSKRGALPMLCEGGSPRPDDSDLCAHGFSLFAAQYFGF